MAKRILVVGASGFIGSRLLKRLGGSGRGTGFQRCSPRLRKFDIGSESIRRLYPPTDRPDVCVLLASETNIDECARNPVATHNLNVDATIQTIKNLIEDRVKPIFISSDTVFDGDIGNYSEVSPPNPILTYGRQKYEVERFIKSNKRGGLVIRLAKTVSSDPLDDAMFGHWLRDALSGRVIRCANDQFQSLIDVDDVVEAIWRLAENDAEGIYHVGGDRKWTRAELFEDFRVEFRETFGRDVVCETCSIRDFQFAEARPLDTSLDSTRIRREYDFSTTDVLETCRSAVSAAAAVSEDLI